MKIKKIYPLQIGQPEKVHIIMIGCGGTGSYAAAHLAQLAYTAKDDGIEVQLIFIDHDKIELKNIGRQNFAPGEINRNKAECLARRYSLAFGLAIRAIPKKFTYDMLPGLLISTSKGYVNIIVGCVDNTAARLEIHKALIREMGLIREYQGRGIWWLDAGNAHQLGQVVLGNSPNTEPLLSPLGFAYALPLPSIQNPDLIKKERPVDISAEDDLSCADLTALGVQARTINKMMATWIDVYLEQMLVSKNLKMMATELDQRAGMVHSRLINYGEIIPLNTAEEQAVWTGQYPDGYPAHRNDDTPEHMLCPQCMSAEVAFGVDELDTEIGVETIVFCPRCDFKVSEAVWEEMLDEVDPYAVAYGEGWEEDDFG